MVEQMAFNHQIGVRFPGCLPKGDIMRCIFTKYTGPDMSSKIKAIKSFREITGFALINTKEIVDSLFDGNSEMH